MLIKTEAALIERISGSMLKLFQSEDAFYVDTGPGEFDGEYLRSVIVKSPAVIVSLLEGAAKDSTLLDFRPVRWSALFVVGWTCENEKERRLGVRGVYAMLSCVLSDLHNTILEAPDGEHIGFVRVERFDNMWNGAFKRQTATIFDVTLAVNMPIAKVHKSELDDFLQLGATYRIAEDAPELEDLIVFMEETNG